ncbi:MAG TPA: energy transducer TonB, partial [Allosphingosinicella sp.]|nr:energy transducer TonB [Allosphingosinicella sp.]
YPGGTSLYIRERVDGRGDLIAINPGWSQSEAATYRLILIRSGDRRPLGPAGGRQLIWRGLAAPIDAEGLAALAGGAAVEVEGPDGRPVERLDPAGLGPARARLGACRAAATAVAYLPPVPAPPPPPSPRRGKQKGARAHANLVALFSSDDYPASAVRAGEEGTVAFRLQVNPTGRVAACTVTQSSGSAALDSTTCRLLASRARFTPARDRKGRAVADSLTGRIIWKLPEPEPAPPPPPPPQS